MLMKKINEYIKPNLKKKILKAKIFDEVQSKKNKNYQDEWNKLKNVCNI